MNRDLLQAAVHAVRDRWPDVAPFGAMILGSGWSQVADAFPLIDVMPYGKIPGLGEVGVSGHVGRLVWADCHGASVLIFQGRRHWYEGEGWTPVAVPIAILRALGAHSLLLTNAAGGIGDGLQPGDLMIIDDHINAMQAHPLIGPHDPDWGPRFPDLSRVYNPTLCHLLERAAGDGPALCRGVYLATGGPTYETPAEVRAYRALGADAVGMSTVPEAILAHTAGLRVAALSCITNRAAGLGTAPLSHDEITETTRRALTRMTGVVLRFWEDLRNEYA